MVAYESITDVIGDTPLVRLHRVTAGLRPRIYVKLEHQNPGGSVKDRAALSMIRAAEADGSLRRGGTIVETTSGNTGIGLALVAAQRGYRSVIFTSRGIAEEKIRLLRAYGAEVRLVDAYLPKSHPDSMASRAARFAAETPGAWRADQYDNPANPAAHRGTTGPEIWADTAGAVTHFVASVGTGGTISGTGAALKELSGGRVRVVAADPDASIYSGGDGSPKYIEGAGHARHPDADQDVWPQSFHTDVVDEYIAVSDHESIFTARRVARDDGVLLGGSAGTALAAALRLAERLGDDDLIVVLAPDSGRNALSTFYDDRWLADRGFIEPGVAAADSDVPIVGDVLDGTALRVPRALSAAQAAKSLDVAGADIDASVLVVYRDGGAGPVTLASSPVPPVELVGVTSLRRLRIAVAAGAGDDPVSLHTTARPPTVGLAVSAETALQRADAAQAGWTTVAVLADGRVVGLVSRELLVAHAAGRSKRDASRVATDDSVDVTLDRGVAVCAEASA